MNNPFFGAMGGGNGFMQMVQQFQQFKANFHGDPKAEVEKLLQSGKLSQDQLQDARSGECKSGAASGGVSVCAEQLSYFAASPVPFSRLHYLQPVGG